MAFICTFRAYLIFFFLSLCGCFSLLLACVDRLLWVHPNAILPTPKRHLAPTQTPSCPHPNVICPHARSIFPVIIFSTLSRLYGDSPYIGIYHNITLVATFVNCAYCFTWDVTMDWGLAQPRAKHAGLRNVLLYQRPHLYYL
jgi:hypothetical protein